MRVQALASVRRDEEALTAANAAITAWELGGRQSIGETAEAVRIAAAIEGFRLGRSKEAVARTSAMITRCRAAGHDRAVTVLTKPAENLQKNGGQ